MPRGQLAHLARPHQQHRLAGEAFEDLAGQLHRRVGDRDREPPDLRLGPYPLGRAERLAHQRVEHRPRRPGGLGQRERVLHLPQDLGLAQHHRVEARRHPEGVERGLLAGHRVEQGLQISPREPAMGSQATEGGRPRLSRHRRDAVDLHPVAGGEDHDLVEEPAPGEVSEDLADLVLLEGELLAQLHRRGTVAQAGHEQGALRAHAQDPWRPVRNAPALSVARSTQKPAIEK